jgi:DeoR family transcriptional regulator, suf operon transcriptional repressor
VIVGDTQQELLTRLMVSKDASSVDELANGAEIARSAVRQHLTS